MLGQFQRNKKLLNNVEIKINELKKELKDKQLWFDHKVKEAEEIDTKLKIVSADINNKNSKFDHKKSILDDLQSAAYNASATIKKEKKSVFSISAFLEKNVNLVHQVNQHQVALKQ